MSKNKNLFLSITISILALYFISLFFNSPQAKKESESAMKDAIKSCTQNIKTKFGEQYDSLINIQMYCECVLTKFKGSTPEELEKSALAIADPNSTIFNEIVLPCTADALIYKKESKQIIGLVSSDTLKIVQTAMGLKLRVQVGKTSYYFILDSGASELFISNRMCQDILKSNPQITVKELPSQNFQMANGTTQLCKRIQVDRVCIGKFIIPNVIFAISPTECTPLLGQDVLSRFKSWSVIENNTKVVFNR